MDITVTVNGTTYERDVEPRKLLIHFLRDDLDLTGSHVGCDTGNCGACSVILDGTLTIGAMTTYSELMASAEAKARPILGEVCATIADVQVRNRGTIGGNVCSNDPTNHLPPLMVAVGARMTIAGVGGERERLRLHPGRARPTPQRGVRGTRSRHGRRTVE